MNTSGLGDMMLSNWAISDNAQDFDRDDLA